MDIAIHLVSRDSWALPTGTWSKEQCFVPKTASTTSVGFEWWLHDGQNDPTAAYQVTSSVEELLLTVRMSVPCRQTFQLLGQGVGRPYWYLGGVTLGIFWSLGYLPPLRLTWCRANTAKLVAEWPVALKTAGPRFTLQFLGQSCVKRWHAEPSTLVGICKQQIKQ